jgi:AraC family transcriptional regulator, transcriptional activator of pobA
VTGWTQLLHVAEALRFQPHDIAAQLDARGNYSLPLEEEFPLSIKLFHYTSRKHTRGATWHERLELFLPLDGPARFQMGGREHRLTAGDLLVVDNLKLHHVSDFPGFNTRAIVISFLPEFVYSLGSPSHDYAFLLPFYSKVANRAHILTQGDPAADAVYLALARLLECYFENTRAFFRAGAKAYQLELLYHLAAHFKEAEILKWQFLRQQEESLRLKKLFEFIRLNPAERLSVAGAARMAGMSPPQFMKTFKRVAGTTLVAYLNHVRLANAAQLLRESNQSIAEIAATVGFSDQSYFDKRFKRAFSMTPMEFRSQVAAPEKS